jgi:hypothetical protein
MKGRWLAVNVMADLSFGGVLPCNECEELHQVFLAAQENARLPRRADQPDASIGHRVTYDAGHGPGFIHPLIPKINAMEPGARNARTGPRMEGMPSLASCSAAGGAETTRRLNTA